MDKLNKGEFFGKLYRKSTLENLIITDTEYTHSKVDWHHHENPYFTYLLQGKLFEANKNASYYLEPGSLLFHNWQDSHYNTKPPEFTRGFHIELNEDWFLNYDIKIKDFEGSVNINDPMIKNSMSKIFVEFNVNDQYSNISIDTCLIEIFSNLKGIREKRSENPKWVKKLQEVLFEEKIDYSLKNLSSILDVHPVHLSREFSKYFGTNLSNYIRLIKVNRAYNLIVSKELSMTEICYSCGFYDQSHFIANFKQIYKTTPSKLLKIIGQC